MAEKIPDPDRHDDTESEANIQRRFNETLGRLVNTPPKPHAPIQPRKAPKERR